MPALLLVIESQVALDEALQPMFDDTETVPVTKAGPTLRLVGLISSSTPSCVTVNVREYPPPDTVIVPDREDADEAGSTSYRIVSLPTPVDPFRIEIHV